MQIFSNRLFQLLCVLLKLQSTVSFTTVFNPQSLLSLQKTTASTSSSSTIILYAKKRRSGLLNSIVKEEGGNVIIPKTTTTTRSKRTTTKKEKVTTTAKNDGSAMISPDLANFMQSKDDDDDDDDDDSNVETTTTSSTVVDDNTIDDDDISTTKFESFTTKKQQNTRRMKQKERIQIEQQRYKQIEKYVNELQDITSQPNCFNNVVQFLQNTFLNDNSNNMIQSQPFKPILQSKQRSNYRLLWVGSDDAICTIGTKLHKVPLARLQEVYITFERNVVNWYEVIRILGPFPNVKNTLSGKSKIILTNNNNNNNNLWQINWDSMIDGTGREYLATEDKIQTVQLQLLFTDEQLIIASAINEEEDGNNNNNKNNGVDNNNIINGVIGENLLVFIRDDDMDDTLEQLRVA